MAMLFNELKKIKNKNKIMFQKTYLKTYMLVFIDKCLNNGSTYTYS